MCKRVAEGWEMSDKTVIHPDTPLENINLEHLNQLNQANATAYDFFLSTRSIFQTQEKVDKLTKYVHDSTHDLKSSPVSSISL